MRIDRVELSWFRRAAESGILDANSKSIVVYGANASGKSTFVDGVESFFCSGRPQGAAEEGQRFYFTVW